MASNLSLKWNEFQNVTSKTLSNIFNNHKFADVTLASEDGEQISAHKIILSSGSAVFERILSVNTDKHFLLYLRGYAVKDLELLLQFIYRGEIEVEAEFVERFLQITREFGVRGVFQNDINQTDSMKDEQFFQQKSNYDETLAVEEPIEFGDESMSRIDEKDALQESSFFGKSEQLMLEDNEVDIKVNSELLEIDIEPKNKTTGGRNYDCHVCGKQYASPGSLHTHTKAKHEKVKYACNDCEYSSSYSFILKAHMQKCHA